MGSNITLPRQLYKRLTLKSQQLKRTPDELVVDLVQQYLRTADDRWQTEFRTLLNRIHTKTAPYASDEIEADITSAAAESKKLRHARRST